MVFIASSQDMLSTKAAHAVHLMQSAATSAFVLFHAPSFLYLYFSQCINNELHCICLGIFHRF